MKSVMCLLQKCLDDTLTCLKSVEILPSVSRVLGCCLVPFASEALRRSWCAGGAMRVLQGSRLLSAADSASPNFWWVAAAQNAALGHWQELYVSKNRLFAFFFSVLGGNRTDCQKEITVYLVPFGLSNTLQVSHGCFIHSSPRDFHMVYE